MARSSVGVSDLELSSYRGQPFFESAECLISSDTTASRPTQPAGAYDDTIAQKHAIDYPLDIVDPSDFAKVHAAMLDRLAIGLQSDRFSKTFRSCHRTVAGLPVDVSDG